MNELSLPDIDKLNLPDVTLAIVTTDKVNAAVNSINISRHWCHFKSIKLLTNATFRNANLPFEVIKIKNLKDREEYSEFCLKHLGEHIETQMCLTIQPDSWVINPGAWDDEWLNYDYLGGLFHSKFWKQQSMGNSGFCLRSKELLERTRYLNLRHKPIFDDIYTCCHNRDWLEREGYKFYSGAQAQKFSICHKPIDDPIPFGFHDLTINNVYGLRDIQLSNQFVSINGDNLDQYKHETATSEELELDAVTNRWWHSNRQRRHRHKRGHGRPLQQ